MSGTHANKIDMQNRLFAELSRMFGLEVPLYDRALLVNRECNKTICSLISQIHRGFSISDEQLDKTSGERHGAIRIGKPIEYRWMARFFNAFAMQPHNYYDMSNVGAKSQPIVATAFRSVSLPEHRVFCSLLQTDYFDPATKARIENLLSSREVFSEKTKHLIEKSEQDGGLNWSDADALIAEGVNRIFKWTGKARDYPLYKDLCDAGFKIAADIACFESHHLNHLTPNTFCIDLYTTAMKFCLGELDAATFTKRATRVLDRLASACDQDSMRLQFKHLTAGEVDAFTPSTPAPDASSVLANALLTRLQQPEVALSALKHAGFKDTTEGPSEDTPVLLRQDAYKALTEPVQFRNSDGSVVDTGHTARFGEIEQRFYATTPKGRALYDTCLSEAEAARDSDPGLANRDFDAAEVLYAKCFSPFPKTLRGLLRLGYAYARYAPTASGLAAQSSISTTDINELIDLGFVQYEGLRYEDFLPVSAAGIFASNLNQYGTKSTAASKPVYTQAMLEEALGMPIIDTDKAYRATEADSLLRTYSQLGLTSRVPALQLADLQRCASELPTGTSAGGSSSQSGARRVSARI